MLNGDLLTQFNVGNMLAFHADGGFKATVGVHEYVHTVPYGVVEREGDRITGIREKPTQTWLANAGIYVFEPDLVERVPQDTYFPLPTLVEECLDRGEAVGAFPIKEDWIDVGHPEGVTTRRAERGTSRELGGTQGPGDGGRRIHREPPCGAPGRIGRRRARLLLL